MARKRKAEDLPEGTSIGDMMADKRSITKVMDAVVKAKKKFKRYKKLKWYFDSYRGTESTPEYQRAPRSYEDPDDYLTMRIAVSFGKHDPMFPRLGTYGLVVWRLGSTLWDFETGYVNDSEKFNVIKTEIRDVLYRPLRQLSGYQRTKEGFFLD